MKATWLHISVWKNFNNESNFNFDISKWAYDPSHHQPIILLCLNL